VEVHKGVDDKNVRVRCGRKVFDKQAFESISVPEQDSEGESELPVLNHRIFLPALITAAIN